MSAAGGTATRGWQVSRHGEPAEAMSLGEVVVPAPAPGQVLLRVRAVALGFPDVLLARGGYQVRPPLPFTPGLECVGDVVALGPGVDAGLTGRRVVGTVALPHGSLAGYALAPAGDVHPAPESLDDAAAAGLHIAYQTGWFALHRRARLRPGETLLVHAAAGGVGSAAVQLGLAAGARVVAVCGGRAKGDVARALGAHLVLDRTSDDLVAAVKEATGGRGADVVFDPVGGDAFAASTRAVAFEGRIVVVGFTSGEMRAAATNHALVKNYAVLGLHWGLYTDRAPELVREAHREICALADAGAVAPLVGERLGLDGAVDGLTRLAAGRTTGRLVVEVAASTTPPAAAPDRG